MNRHRQSLLCQIFREGQIDGEKSLHIRDTPPDDFAAVVPQIKRIAGPEVMKSSNHAGISGQNDAGNTERPNAREQICLPALLVEGASAIAVKCGDIFPRKFDESEIRLLAHRIERDEVFNQGRALQQTELPFIYFLMVPVAIASSFSFM